MTAPALVESIATIPADDIAIINSILEPARPQQKHGKVVNEGFRFVALGETGSGKTTLERAVVYTCLQRGYAEFALIQDSKGIFPEFPRSVQLPNIDAFIARGFQRGDIPAVSFRGDVRNDIVVTAEDVGSFARLMLKQGKEVNGRWSPRPIVTVIEELAEASSAGRKHVNAPSVLWLAEQGRKVGGSLVGTTQSPRRVPLDLLGQASSTTFFRLTGADANYLGERLDMDPVMIETVRGQNNEGLPNFKFVLAIKGKPWDGLIHQLDPKTVAMFE
jgi:hypothetical protein